MVLHSIPKRVWSRRGVLGGMSVAAFTAPSRAEFMVACAGVRLGLSTIERRNHAEQVASVAARMTQVLDEIAYFGPVPAIVRFAAIPLSRHEPWTTGDIRLLVASLADHIAPHARQSHQWIMFGCDLDKANPIAVVIDPDGRSHRLNQSWNQDWMAASFSQDAGCDEVVRVNIPAAELGRAVFGSTNPRMIS